MRPMTPRVLFVDQSGAPGGAELALLDVVKDHLPNCTVVLFSDGLFRGMLQDIGARVVVLPLGERASRFRRDSRMWAAFLAIPQLAAVIWRLIRLAKQHDIVFANTQKAFALAAVAAKLGRRPCVWWLQDILNRDHFSDFSRRISVAMANRLAARVFGNSSAATKSFLDAGGDPGKTRTVLLGIDANAFAVEDAGRGAEIRERLGVSKDAIVVGSFSRLSPWKGQHVLIQAIAKTPKFHALIVGSELFGESAYVQSLRDLVRELGVEQRVHFYGFTQNVVQPMAACDIIVHTSTAPEPFGRVLVEAMLAKRPLVATRAGGPLEIIEDGHTGILVPLNDSDALAEVLMRLAADPHLRRRLALEGYRRAESVFSLAAMLDAIRRELKEVPLAPRARRRVA
jgi:glycosyltransferase involved in cell wall biosynthesis